MTEITRGGRGREERREGVGLLEATLDRGRFTSVPNPVEDADGEEREDGENGEGESEETPHSTSLVLEAKEKRTWGLGASMGKQEGANLKKKSSWTFSCK
jgi:hypothetical protein